MLKMVREIVRALAQIQAQLITKHSKDLSNKSRAIKELVVGGVLPYLMTWAIERSTFIIKESNMYIVKQKVFFFR